MRTEEQIRQARLHRIGLWLLALGLVSALVIYVVAPPDASGPLGEQTGSKQYLHDLAVVGGKANILQDQFRRWFAGLWHGRSLAGTVAVLSLVAFAAIRLIAGPRPRAEPATPAARATGRDHGRLRLVSPEGPAAGRETGARRSARDGTENGGS